LTPNVISTPSSVNSVPDTTWTPALQTIACNGGRLAPRTASVNACTDANDARSICITVQRCG
jgi:hypothetical protein